MNYLRDHQSSVEELMDSNRDALPSDVKVE
jgi:hypothetical protein